MKKETTKFSNRIFRNVKRIAEHHLYETAYATDTMNMNQRNRQIHTATEFQHITQQAICSPEH